jgi:hypothetical protein
MSDGMTDNRSQPDDVIELRKRVVEDATINHVEAAATANDLLKRVAADAEAFGLTPSEWIRRQLAKAREAAEGRTGSIQFGPQDGAPLSAEEAAKMDAASKTRPATGPTPEQRAAIRNSFARSHDFEERHAALDLAVKHHAAVGANAAVLSTAGAFLDWMQGRISNELARPDKVEIAVESTAPQPDELPPYLAAEVGDVIELDVGAPGKAQECLVIDIERRQSLADNSRLLVRMPHGHAWWAVNGFVKRIVRKAGNKASGA